MYIKERLKSIRAHILGLDPGFLKLYYKFLHRPKPQTLSFRLYQLSKGKKPFHFFQVGGNDGYSKDPIFKFVKLNSWKGIIVEPQKEVFNKRLKRTYRFSKNVILENVAISNESYTRKLYKIAISNSRWATGLATFNRAVIEKCIQSKHIIEKARKEKVTKPNTPENWITHEEVNCTSIDNLLFKHHFDCLDLLQIDAEGYDFEIIKLIDFTRLKPPIICFEYFHLSENDRAACEKILSKQGYLLEYYEPDCIAVLQESRMSHHKES